MRRLSEIRAPADALFVVQIVFLAALTPLLMRFSLGRVKTLLEPRSTPPRPDEGRERHVLALVNLVLDIGRPVLRPTCLTRGVTRYYALRSAGVDVALAFGVEVGQPTGSKVDGHCWLIRNGEPFLELRDPRDTFTEMYRVSSALGVGS